MEPRFFADCQARVATDLLSGRWPMVVLYSLATVGPSRPGVLAEQIGGISQKVLTDTLRRLQANGLVERHRYAEAPPRVEYSLTEAGQGLIGPLEALGEWAQKYGDDVLAAQEAAGY
ncbi:winged helix-turn-helix transcriptional regulator [Kribbella monticola]|uniref:winged helix-turn-helix transcriptional regulator n=1 Tax=Kribbella monticola TaxID=2185285 RepID=UPI001E30D64B|nr:helix-turn-helix domain-containing protein [Kribbella monticola]